MANILEKKILFIVIYLSFLFIIAASEKKQPTFTRHLTTEIRCADKDVTHENGSYPNVVYSKATGKNDSLHYILSTIGKPTVVMVRTDTESEIEIDCNKLLSKDLNGSITFNNAAPLYSQTVIFDRLLEYNDTDDVADLTKVSQNPALWHVYDLEELPWRNCSEVSNISGNVISFMLDSDTDKLKFLPNGSLSLQFQLFDHLGREDELPHLQFTANSSQFSLILDQIDTPFSGSRFALEMTVVTSDSPNITVAKSTTHFIDDEHTPGQFEMTDWTFGDPLKSLGAFLQWKPVSYLKSDRNFKTATKAKDYPLQKSNLNKSEYESNIAYAFYGDLLFDDSLATRSTNVSFGLSKDKFYVLNHYTAWTASMGYGNPPQDTVSALIIIVISVGLGIPVFIIIFGGIGVCIKKSKDRKEEDFTSSYTAVQ